jgi:glycosyltransferase involved in cell wall biosynthesis
VVLEAQSSGLPVIVTDKGGPHELVIDGETGVVFSAGDHHELSEAIHGVIIDGDLLALMGSNARRFILERKPESSRSYSTILESGRCRDGCTEDQRMAAAA